MDARFAHFLPAIGPDSPVREIARRLKIPPEYLNEPKVAQALCRLYYALQVKEEKERAKFEKSELGSSSSPGHIDSDYEFPSTPYVSTETLSEQEMQEWLENPNRHVHGGERSYNQRPRPPEGTRHDISLLAEYAKVIPHLPGMTAFRVSATENTNWNGGWDNVVRVFEESER